MRYWTDVWTESKQKIVDAKQPQTEIISLPLGAIQILNNTFTHSENKYPAFDKKTKLTRLLLLFKRLRLFKY